MDHQTYLQDLKWRIDLAEYQEFCDDLENGLHDLRSAPSSYLQRDAWSYLQFSPEEARRTFRSPIYHRHPSRAIKQWGEDAGAPQRARDWADTFLQQSAHLSFFGGSIPTRLQIHAARRYLKLRESKTHEQALEAALGVTGAKVQETCLRQLAEVRLVPAKTIRRRLFERSREFHPLVYKESKHPGLNKNMLRYVGTFDEFDYRLVFDVEDRAAGGLTADLFVRHSSKKRENDIVLRIANPPWDVMTSESLESGLNYLVKKVRVRLDAMVQR